MANLELWLASKDTSLSVRSFSVHEPMSALFDVSIIARSDADDLPLEDIVGHAAGFRISHFAEAPRHHRLWTGLCTHAELLEVEAAGLSTYFLRLVPDLWRATQRKNCRIFQHKSAPDIAAELLAEWNVRPELRLDAKTYPRFEYRVQYGETDFAFLGRLLEEAGIAYFFEPAEEQDAKGNSSEVSRLVLSDRPQNAELRHGSPIAFYAVHASQVGGPGGTTPPADREWITAAKVAHRTRPGKLTVRDFDFRSRPDVVLLAEAKAAIAVESRYEVFDYLPGAFLVEEPGAADPRARTDEKEGKNLAARRLDGVRRARRHLLFKTTAPDLSPGTVFSIDRHPRAELAREHKLLTVSRTIEGSIDGEWTFAGEAVFAAEPYRPELTLVKPRVVGVQSAVVVGPPDEEIHTDEYGRVRVQFHWDREGTFDAKSSCWIRVSQGWAGGGFGMQALPRVGQEVLVDFFEGDPDQPVVVGRVFNNWARVPYKLPDQRTRSAWKGRSSPASMGSNEIMLEDAAGQELVYFHAERDLEEVVKNDLRVSVGQNADRQVAKSELIQVGESRIATVGKIDVSAAGQVFVAQAGKETGLVLQQDGKVVLTNGQASITFDGPNITIHAGQNLEIAGGNDVTVSGSKVHVDGSPNVFFNSGTATQPAPLALFTQLLGNLEATTAADLTKLEGSVTAAENQLVDGLMQLPGEAVAALLAIPQKALAALQTAETKALSALGQIEQHAVDDVTKKANAILDQALDGVKAKAHELPKLLNAPKHLNDQIKQAAAAAMKKEGLIVSGLKSKAALLEAQAKNDVHAAEAEAKAKVAQAEQKLKNAEAQVKAFEAGVKTQAKAVVGEAKAQLAAAKQEVHALEAHAKAELAGAKEALAQAKADAAAVKSALKQAFGDAKSDAKQGVGSAKAEVSQLKGEAKQAVAEAKADAAAVKSELKQAFGGAKSEAQQAATGAKAEASQVNGEAKQAAAGEAKQAAGGAKQAAGGAKQAASAGLDQAKSSAAVARDALHGARSDLAPGKIASRAGGLSGYDVGHTLQSTSGAAIVQSPSEGQMMVLHTATARPISPGALSAHVVEAQMNGHSVGSAVAGKLTEHGYAVYSRPFADFTGPFVKAPAV